jgi:peptidoglycan/LPS O-acetylase OafA/YrhL
MTPQASPSGLKMGLSLEQRLSATRGRPTGFDLLRVVLATSVVVWHTVVVSYGIGIQDAILASRLRFAPALILPMFFALSGFLVAGSLQRTKTLVVFLGLRILRIFPALAVETTLSALVLGPLLTSFSLQEYFSSPQLYTYLWNLVGYVHLELPGVFWTNPHPAVVNGQLWTVPYELECYVLLAALALIPFFSFRRIILLAVTFGQLAFAWRAIFGAAYTDSLIPGRVLVFSFVGGVAVYVYRQVIPWSRGLALGTFLLSVILLNVHGGAYFVAVPVAYLTVYVGLLNPKKPRFLGDGDYSYGIFLYGYPIQQAIASLGTWTHNWYLNLLLSFPIIVLFAMLSWHGVEKHALKFRHPLAKWDAGWLKWGSLNKAQVTETSS